MTRMLGVESEVRRPRQLIMRRAGSELTRLTPSNCNELLFDDVLWVSELSAAKAFVLERVCTVHRALNAMNAPGLT